MPIPFTNLADFFFFFIPMILILVIAFNMFNYRNFRKNIERDITKWIRLKSLE